MIARPVGSCPVEHIAACSVAYHSCSCAAGAGWPLPERPTEGKQAIAKGPLAENTAETFQPRNGWPVLAYVPVNTPVVQQCAYTDTYIVRGASSVATEILRASSSGPVFWKVCTKRVLGYLHMFSSVVCLCHVLYVCDEVAGGIPTAGLLLLIQTPECLTYKLPL